jgi:hypothetical protein
MRSASRRGTRSVDRREAVGPRHGFSRTSPPRCWPECAVGLSIRNGGCKAGSYGTRLSDSTARARGACRLERTTLGLPRSILSAASAMTESTEIRTAAARRGLWGGSDALSQTCELLGDAISAASEKAFSARVLPSPWILRN